MTEPMQHFRIFIFLFCSTENPRTFHEKIFRKFKCYFNRNISNFWAITIVLQRKCGDLIDVSYGRFTSISLYHLEDLQRNGYCSTTMLIKAKYHCKGTINVLISYNCKKVLYTLCLRFFNILKKLDENVSIVPLTKVS